MAKPAGKKVRNVNKVEHLSKNRTDAPNSAPDPHLIEASPRGSIL